MLASIWRSFSPGWSATGVQLPHTKRLVIRIVSNRLSLSNIRTSIGTENPVPKEMDHPEITVCVPVMNKVQLLFPSEPGKPQKPRSLNVVFLVEKYVRVERRRTRDYKNHEKIDGN